MKRTISLLVLIFTCISFLPSCSPAVSTQAPVAPVAATEVPNAPVAATEVVNTPVPATAAPVAEPTPETAVMGSDVPTASSNLDADITVIQALDMTSFDPIVTSDLSTSYIIQMVYSRLFTADDKARGVLELAQSTKKVSDTEWQFTIPQGVKFHDGSIMTVDDVVWSLNRTKTGTAIGALFKPVKAITKVDDSTIDITTDGPYPALPDALAHIATSIVPRAYGEKAAASKDWTHPVGSGRYMFKSRVIGDSITLVRFDDYYNQAEKARNKSLTYKVIPEGSGRTIAIETGVGDISVDFDPVDYDHVMNEPDKVKLWQHFSQNVWHVGMDVTNANFTNKLVRQAVSFAIDHDAAMAAGHNGHGTIMWSSSTFAPTTLGAINNPLNMYSYDPEKAKQLMAQAGVKGFDTEIIVFRDEAERIATVVQSELAEIGINAKVTRIENAVFASYIAAHKAPMYITSWGCYWDADLFVPRRLGQAGIGGVNRSWYLNPELDKMIIQGRIGDETQRAAVYKQIQEFMAPEAPEVDLYVNTIYALANPKLKGVELTTERAFNYWKLHY
jgi:peptide/nickel transport system substrate-binding protein